MLAELMSGKCSGVLWRKSRGHPLAIPCANAGEQWDGGEGPGQENQEGNHPSTSLQSVGSACPCGLELLSKMEVF